MVDISPNFTIKNMLPGKISYEIGLRDNHQFSISGEIEKGDTCNVFKIDLQTEKLFLVIRLKNSSRQVYF